MTSRIGNLLRLDELDQLKDSEFKAYLWSLYPVFLYPKPNFKNSFNFILRMCQKLHYYDTNHIIWSIWWYATYHMLYSSCVNFQKKIIDDFVLSKGQIKKSTRSWKWFKQPLWQNVKKWTQLIIWYGSIWHRLYHIVYVIWIVSYCMIHTLLTISTKMP